MGNTKRKYTPVDLKNAILTHSERVFDIINTGIGINTRFAGKETALLLAVKQGRKDIVMALLKKGARVNVSNKSGETPLLYAIVTGEPETAHALLDMGADAKVAIPGKFNALAYTANIKDGNQGAELAQRLIDMGAEVNFLSEKNKTPLIFAAYVGSTKVVEVLIANGANVTYTYDEDSALRWAVFSGHRETAKVLLNNGASLKDKYIVKEAINSSTWYSEEGATRLFFELGGVLPQTDEHGKSTLISLLEKGVTLELVKKALKLGLTTEATKEEITESMKYNADKKEKLELLIKYGILPDHEERDEKEGTVDKYPDNKN